MKYLFYTLALSMVMVTTNAQRPPERRHHANEQSKQADDKKDLADQAEQTLKCSKLNLSQIN